MTKVLNELAEEKEVGHVHTIIQCMCIYIYIFCLVIIHSSISACPITRKFFVSVSRCSKKRPRQS